MAEPHVLSALTAKRAAIDGEIRGLTKRLADLHTHRNTIDGAICLFDPSRIPHKIKPIAKKLRPRMFRHGECVRAVLSLMRVAGTPLTVMQITDRLIEEYHLKMPQTDDYDALVLKVRNVLARKLSGGGLARERNGRSVQWLLQ